MAGRCEVEVGTVYFGVVYDGAVGVLLAGDIEIVQPQRLRPDRVQAQVELGIREV